MAVRLVLVLVLVLLVGGYVGWPYYTLYRIHVALDDGDTAALDDLVDWDAVRAGMERELAARNLSGQEGAPREAEARTGGLVALVAPRVGEFLADAHASPRGLARLIRDSGPRLRPAEEASADGGDGARRNDASAEPFQPDVVAAVAYARDQVEAARERAVDEYQRLRRDYDYLFFTGPLTFQARHAPGSPDQVEPLVLVLRFEKLAWRLTKVDLPRTRGDDNG